MTIGLSKDWRSPTNVVSPLISMSRCSSSWRSRALLLYDDDTCMGWLVSCKDMERPRRPRNLIPLSSSPSCRAALLYSYSQPPMTTPCWSNWLSSDDGWWRPRSPVDLRATGMSLYLMDARNYISIRSAMKVPTYLTVMALWPPSYCNANMMNTKRQYRGTAERTAFRIRSWSRRLSLKHSFGYAHVCATWPDDSWTKPRRRTKRKFQHEKRLNFWLDINSWRHHKFPTEKKKLKITSINSESCQTTNMWAAGAQRRKSWKVFG